MSRRFLALVVAVLCYSGACATTGERAVSAARQDFPACAEFRYAGMWEDEAVVVACGIPASYSVTLLETKRVR